MTNKRLIRFAHILSAVFSPFYAPLLAFLWLFFFSYLKLLPLGYKIWILALVFVFTIFIPRMSIGVFRRINRWTRWQLSKRRHRHMPYILTLLSYSICLYMLSYINTAMFFRGIVMAALAIQIICVCVNTWWKVSTHMAGIGGLVGALVSFSYIFYYNPVWPVCVMLILSGMLGTSRMVLRQHTLSQVLGGFFIGMVSTMVFTLIRWV